MKNFKTLYKNLTEQMTAKDSLENWKNDDAKRKSNEAYCWASGSIGRAIVGGGPCCWFDFPIAAPWTRSRIVGVGNLLGLWTFYGASESGKGAPTLW